MQGDFECCPVSGETMREPIFNAMDQLRIALDHANRAGNDRVVGLLLIALQDLADTLEFTGDETVVRHDAGWAVAKRRFD